MCCRCHVLLGLTFRKLKPLLANQALYTFCLIFGNPVDSLAQQLTTQMMFGEVDSPCSAVSMALHRQIKFVCRRTRRRLFGSMSFCLPTSWANHGQVFANRTPHAHPSSWHRERQLVILAPGAPLRLDEIRIGQHRVIEKAGLRDATSLGGGSWKHRWTRSTAWLRKPLGLANLKSSTQSCG